MMDKNTVHYKVIEYHKKVRTYPPESYSSFYDQLLKLS